MLTRRGSSLAVTGVALLSLVAGALADDEHDHERARAAREAGRVLPLATILARVQRTFPGEVLEVELEDEGREGRLVYEIKLLQPGGRLVELLYDAATGELLRGERPRGTSDPRR
jgi:uncharacterized membrane protein YkoI